MFSRDKDLAEMEVPVEARPDVQRHLTSAQTHRVLRPAAMTTWRTAVAAA